MTLEQWCNENGLSLNTRVRDSSITWTFPIFCYISKNNYILEAQEMRFIGEGYTEDEARSKLISILKTVGWVIIDIGGTKLSVPKDLI